MTRGRLLVALVLVLSIVSAASTPAGAVEYTETFDDNVMPGLFVTGGAPSEPYWWGQHCDPRFTSTLGGAVDCMGGFLGHRLRNTTDGYTPRGVGFIPYGTTVSFDSIVGGQINTEVCIHLHEAVLNPVTGLLGTVDANNEFGQHLPGPDFSGWGNPRVRHKRNYGGLGTHLAWWREHNAANFPTTAANSLGNRRVTITSLQPGKPYVLRARQCSSGGAELWWGIDNFEGLGTSEDLNLSDYPGAIGLAGGTFAPFTDDAFLPRLSCGVTLRNLNGTWFADVEARLENPSLHPGIIDEPGVWRVGWDQQAVFSGDVVTIPLPANFGTSDAWWILSYHAYRQYDPTVSLNVGPDQLGWGEWKEVVGPYDETLFGLVKSWGDLATGNTQTYWVFYEDDEVRDYSAVLPPIIGGTPENPEYGPLVVTPDAVRTQCLIPVNRHLGETHVTTTQPGTPADPHDPGENPGPPPGTDSPDQACGSGGAWWNPVTWGKSLFCGLVDLAKLLGKLISVVLDVLAAILGLAASILNGLVGLLVPSSLDFLDGLQADWSNKFPLSVLDEAAGAFSNVRSALLAGLDAECGPELNPNLGGAGLDLPGVSTADMNDIKVSLPTPNANCEQSAASLQIANLNGARRPVRGMLEAFLIVGFCIRMAHSIGPGPTAATPGVGSNDR